MAWKIDAEAKIEEVFIHNLQFRDISRQCVGRGEFHYGRETGFWAEHESPSSSLKQVQRFFNLTFSHTSSTSSCLPNLSFINDSWLLVWWCRNCQGARARVSDQAKQAHDKISYIFSFNLYLFIFFKNSTPPFPPEISSVCDDVNQIFSEVCCVIRTRRLTLMFSGNI